MAVFKDFRRRIYIWYSSNQRQLPWRERRSIYAIWVSEVMLQQTQVKTVIPYYQRFLARFPNVNSLAAADQQDVLKLWEGLGYYARARNLHRAAQAVMVRFNGQIPSDYADFRSLPGVGPYIGAAVMSIALGYPRAVVDGNVKRVLARIFMEEAAVNIQKNQKIYDKLAQAMLDPENPGDYNQAVMELGALICTPRRPLCDACPVNNLCRARQNGVVAAYPRRIKRLPIPTHQIACGVVFKAGRVLITRRKPDGLLGGLWEFPGGKIKPDENADAACRREIFEETGLVVAVADHLTQVRHAYTHFKIVMEVYLCHYQSGRVALKGPIDHHWVRFDELRNYPMPKANLKLMPSLKQALS
jgi:A/G-specific adenine glycosylase